MAQVPTWSFPKKSLISILCYSEWILLVNDQRQPQVRKRNNTWIWLFRTEDLRAPSESNCLILSATRLLVFFYFYWFRGSYHFDEMSYSRRFWFQEGKRFDFWKLEMITQIPHCDNSPSYDSCNIDFSIIIEDAIMQEERFHNYGDLRLFIDFIRLKL